MLWHNRYYFYDALVYCFIMPLFFMRNSIYVFIVIAFTLFLLSCNKVMNKVRLIDNPQLIETLQEQVDTVLLQGYQIDEINIYTKSFAEFGSSDEGNLNFMFIHAVAADTSIAYYANYSYSDEVKILDFHGYPNTSGNKRKKKIYCSVPDLPAAIAKLDEMKNMIPAGYQYEKLLYVRYTTMTDGRGVYDFEVEVKPDSKESSHPKVKQQERTHADVTKGRTSRRHVGGIRDVYKTDFKKKTEYTIKYRLINDIIEIQ